MIGEESEEDKPVGIDCAFEMGLPGEVSEAVGESAKVLTFHFFGCEEVECRFIFDELGDEGCFTDTPTSADNYEAAVFGVVVVQGPEFFFSADECHGILLHLLFV